ncbi:MAG: type II toxin-antitoxin system PemK/MazF family toxin [Candidatus Gracilibacteria bacterium]|nr:type II toxin-antitoxin system PemK/MazF family toxin [Candidatus Gracilibacteria bacterium]
MNLNPKQEKTFKEWNNEKEDIENKKSIRTFREGETWYISMGKNIGFEQNLKGELFLRPVLVLKKFNKNIFIGIPLTTVEKNDIFHYCFKGTNGKTSYAILSQIRLYDSKRFFRKTGNIKFSDIKILKEKIRKLIL